MRINILGLSNFCGAVAAWLCLMPVAFADASFTTPSTPASTSAHQIFTLPLFLIWIVGGIFLLVGGLLAFAPFKLRTHRSDLLSPAGAGLSERRNLSRLDGDSRTGACPFSRVK
jgi:heme/copper-type cytochrome/quinol oxidase subunit 2